MIFCHKRKIDNFNQYNVLLAIAIYPCYLWQGHIYVVSNEHYNFPHSFLVFIADCDRIMVQHLNKLNEI